MNRSLRLVLVAGAVVLGATALGGRAEAAPAAATTSCRSIGGGPVAGAGSHHATVVVDTGSGPVWSACVSFDGTISGVQALELAEQTIADLDPVWDTYAGEGRAVCRLRGVGTDPPDCLGKDISYWQYYVNGTYARGGAGTTPVHDGDVNGWRYGSGKGSPRPATQGTEAVATPVATTTTRPPATTTTTAAPGHGGLTGQPGSTPTTAPPSGGSPSGATTTTGRPGTTTTGPARPTTTAEGDGSPGASEGSGASGGDQGGAKEAAAGAAVARSSGGPSGSTGGTSGTGPGPGAASLVGFLAALAAVGGAAVLVRRRRLAAGTPAGPTAAA
ncbi:MAG: DUF4430 domain-containing protein [Acidimicrobiales bacterium]